MKIGLISDTHFGARSDSLPMQKNMQKFLDNVFFPTLDKYGITRVIHAGDYFDRRKFVNFQTAQFIRQGYRAGLRKRNINEDVIVGNHDIFYRHSTELNAIQELYEGDPAVKIHTSPTELVIDNTCILLLPWITENNREASMQMIKNSACSIVVGHLELAGFQMYRGMPAHEGMSTELFERFDLVMSGHFHHKSQKGTINYLGAPWAMTWSDYRDPRGFHILDTDTKELEFIENPYSMFARLVYDDDGKDHSYIKGLIDEISAVDSPYRDAYVKIVVKSKSQPYWFELLMDALYKMDAQDVIVVDDILVNDEDLFNPTDETPDVDTLTLIREYVDDLSINCDKNELFTYLKTKYHEALSANQSSRLS